MNKGRKKIKQVILNINRPSMQISNVKAFLGTLGFNIKCKLIFDCDKICDWNKIKVHTEHIFKRYKILFVWNLMMQCMDCWLASSWSKVSIIYTCKTSTVSKAIFQFRVMDFVFAMIISKDDSRCLKKFPKIRLRVDISFLLQMYDVVFDKQMF